LNRSCGSDYSERKNVSAEKKREEIREGARRSFGLTNGQGKKQKRAMMDLVEDWVWSCGSGEIGNRVVVWIERGWNEVVCGERGERMNLLLLFFGCFSHFLFFFFSSLRVLCVAECVSA
jgi:hypothetical protein